MSSQTFDMVLLVVYFAYGLAFFGMGLTLALESERSPALADARLLRPLAAFGMIHGVHEWLDSYLLQPIAGGIQLPAWVLWLRLGLLVGSFSALLIYGILTLRAHPLKPGIFTYAFWVVLILYVLGILTSAIFTYRTGTTLLVNLYDVLCRYLLAVPAAVLAAVSLRAEAISAANLNRRRVMTLPYLSGNRLWTLRPDAIICPGNRHVSSANLKIQPLSGYFRVFLFKFSGLS